MSRRTLSALTLLAFVMVTTFAFAQEPVLDPVPTYTGKSFKLLRDDDRAARDLDLAEEEVVAWDPILKQGTIEVSLGIGFLNLNKTLLQHDQIIYKYNTDSTFWGDMEITGESAFAPTLRLGYAVNRWFSVEGWAGVSISEYSSTITNTFSRKNESPPPAAVPNPPMGEFDAEARSMITLQTGVNAVVYPLSIRGDSKGRWHPYLTGGAGNMWYDMNSNYVEGSTSAMDLNFGGGLRILADRNVSVRLEVIMHHNELDWTPAEYFMELNEGTTKVPLNEYPILPDGTMVEGPVEDFAPNTMSLMQWSLGVQGSF